jgi:hypothetical protein
MKTGLEMSWRSVPKPPAAGKSWQRNGSDRFAITEELVVRRCARFQPSSESKPAMLANSSA